MFFFYKYWVYQRIKVDTRTAIDFLLLYFFNSFCSRQFNSLAMTDDAGKIGDQSLDAQSHNAGTNDDLLNKLDN